MASRSRSGRILGAVPARQVVTVGSGQRLRGVTRRSYGGRERYVPNGVPRGPDLARSGRQGLVSAFDEIHQHGWALRIMLARSVPVTDAELEVFDWGWGEPVVFVQTALTADELRPLANEPALKHGYRKILYHRRGYAGSSPVEGPGSIVRDAADCAALLARMEVDRAHIVGLSYSGAVGLQMAADAQGCTHSLVLIEPPPVHTPSAPEFRAANDRLMQTRRDGDPRPRSTSS